jgi:predicted phage tail protein
LPFSPIVTNIVHLNLKKTHMKKILLPFFMLFGVLLFDSCELDKLDKPAVLSTAPVITLTGPSTVTAGLSTELVAVARDGNISPITSATIKLLNGKTVVSQNTSTTIVDGAITLKIAGSVVAGLFPGTYKLDVSAVDSQGKTSTPFAVDIAVSCPPLPSCVVKGKLTVIVLVPANTPADASVGLVGGSTGWGSNPDLAMTKIATGCYCASTNVTNVTTGDLNQFKFRLDNNWDRQAAKVDDKTGACSDSDNVKYIAEDIDKSITLSVPKWKHLCN